MRMVFALSTGVALCLAVGAAFAQSQPQEISQPTANPATTSSPPGTPANQVICRPVVRLGSLIQSQDCRTKAEWDTVRFRNQQELNQIQTRSLTTSGPGH
jgi:hypothetical protein